MSTALRRGLSKFPPRPRNPSHPQRASTGAMAVNPKSCRSLSPSSSFVSCSEQQCKACARPRALSCPNPTDCTLRCESILQAFTMVLSPWKPSTVIDSACLPKRSNVCRLSSILTSHSTLVSSSSTSQTRLPASTSLNPTHRCCELPECRVSSKLPKVPRQTPRSKLLMHNPCSCDTTLPTTHRKSDSELISASAELFTAGGGSSDSEFEPPTHLTSHSLTPLARSFAGSVGVNSPAIPEDEVANGGGNGARIAHTRSLCAQRGTKIWILICVSARTKKPRSAMRRAFGNELMPLRLANKTSVPSTSSLSRKYLHTRKLITTLFAGHAPMTSFWLLIPQLVYSDHLTDNPHNL